LGADKLGCEGNIRIEGPAIDVTKKLGLGLLSDRAFVSFADGTFGVVAPEFFPEARRLDERLETLEAHPLGRLFDTSAGSSGSLYHLRNGGHAGIFYGGRTTTGAVTQIASLLGYDFAANEALEERYAAEVEGLPVVGWGATGDDTESFAWARLTEGANTVQWRRPFRKGGAWQRTGIDRIPTAQWQEGGKAHFLALDRDVVLAPDGKVESDTPFSAIPETTTPCATSTIARTGTSLVTVRNVVSVPCSDPARNTTPFEIWVHLPNDTTGRKLAENIPRSASFPLVELNWGPKVDSFVRVDRSDPTKFTAKLQRLDASLRDLGNAVEVTLPGRNAPSTLSPVAGGYYWFVGNILDGGTTITTSAYHLVCAP